MSQELSTQAGELLKTISFFRVSGVRDTVTPPLPAPPDAVTASDQVQTARPRQPQPERAYAGAGTVTKGVLLDLGTHRGGSGKNGDGGNEEFEKF